MKVKSVKNLQNAISEKDAEKFFEDIELFSNYGFVKSHSVSYSLLSYVMGYLKSHYTIEFIASALTVTMHLNDDSATMKLKNIIREAEKFGIKVLPPDINISTNKFEIVDGDIVAPITAVKMVSEKAYAAIEAARVLAGSKQYEETKKVKGKLITKVINNKHYDKNSMFHSFDSLYDLVERRSCNIRVQENLRSVGAFASIEPDTPSATHESRLKDQLTLMDGVFLDYVKADRYIDILANEDALAQNFYDISDCKDCDHCDQPHPKSYFTEGAEQKIMVVIETPGNNDTGTIDLLDKAPLWNAAAGAGFNPEDIYLTTMFKAQKLDKDSVTPDHQAVCIKWLEKEIELLNPAVIICCGAKVIRQLTGAKGSAFDLFGETQYVQATDRTYIFSPTPNMVYYRPEFQQQIDDALDIARTITLNLE